MRVPADGGIGVDFKVDKEAFKATAIKVCETRQAARAIGGAASGRNNTCDETQRVSVSAEASRVAALRAGGPGERKLGHAQDHI